MPYSIDPLGVPFMQKALGQGQLTEKELQEILRGPNSPFGGMGMSVGGGLGMGQLAQVPGPRPVQSNMFGPSGNGPNASLMGALTGESATQDGNGNWIPGPQGFGTASVGQRLGGMMGK